MATFTVTTTADSTGDDGELSLREALAEADAARGADTVDFDLAAMGGSGIVLAGSELTVGSDVTIDGGTGVMVDANQQSRVLLVQRRDADVVLEHLTISGGLVTGYGEYGGGIFADVGTTLTLTGTTVSDNSTAGAALGGGGIASIGLVTLINSTVSGNSASGSYVEGGGVLCHYGIAATSSTITGNRVSGENTQGGGVGVSFNTASLSFINCIVAGNSADGYEPDVEGVLSLTGGPNIFGSQVGGNVAGANLMNVSPAIVFAAINGATGGGQLTDNGGPTPTVALLDAASNPALDAARAIAGLTTDQRGEPRPAPGQTQPDIGAFELQTQPTTLHGVRGDDHLRGGDRGEVLHGRGGDDQLHGDGGGDRLEGGHGRDVLVGGADGDLLIGGPGADRFVLAAGHGHRAVEDLILDFRRAQGDRIDLRRLDGDPDRAGDQPLELIGARRFDEPGQARIDDSAGFTRVEVNLDSDRHAEASLRLDREVPLDAHDFLL